MPLVAKNDGIRLVRIRDRIRERKGGCNRGLVEHCVSYVSYVVLASTCKSEISSGDVS